jgi:predicted amidohydrolase
MLTIALASPPFEGTIEGALSRVEPCIAEAAARGAAIVCFPECYIPGLRGTPYPVQAHDPEGLRAALDTVRAWAQAHAIAVIMPMDWDGPEGILNCAFVIDADGTVTGCQTKNQIAPEEDPYYVPGNLRELFEVNGVAFGIAICHEGWRYPEAVRWAATRGARIVFHPQMAGDDGEGRMPRRFGDPDAPYYEKAMLCRALENGVFFASVNYGLKRPEAATAAIGPEGELIAQAPYGAAGVLVVEIDPDEAHGLYARRFAVARY